MAAQPAPIVADPVATNSSPTIDENVNPAATVLGTVAGRQFELAMQRGEVANFCTLTTNDLGGGSTIEILMCRNNPDVGIRISNPRNNPDSALFSISCSEWSNFVKACKSAPNATPGEGSSVNLYSGVFQKGYPISDGNNIKLSIDTTSSYEGISYGIGIEHLNWKNKTKPRDGTNWFAFWENAKDRDDFLAILNQVTIVLDARGKQ